MIDKLKKKFIVINMILVSIILLITFIRAIEIADEKTLMK